MGKLSRRKGRSFEQLIATCYRETWPAAKVRRSLQAHKPYEPDVVIEPASNLPAWVTALWTECQHAQDPTPLDKLAQAERDIAEFNVNRPSTVRGHARVPIVVWRKHGSSTINLTTRLKWLHVTTTKPDRFAPDLAPLLPGAQDMVITLDFDLWLELIGSP